jgi:hypothetical protein
MRAHIDGAVAIARIIADSGATGQLNRDEDDTGDYACLKQDGANSETPPA